MTRIPEIMTEKLDLRGFTREDAADVFAYASDPAVLRYTVACTPRSPRETEEFVERMLCRPTGDYAWAIRLRAGTEGRAPVVGAIEFRMDEDGSGAVHYALARECWNRGLMTEACRAVIAWAFRVHPGLERVISVAMTVNRRSTRVMEKCGMRFVKTTREKWEKFPEPVELAIYAIDREIWEREGREEIEAADPAP